MQYLLLINESEDYYSGPDGETRMAETIAKHGALAEKLVVDGVEFSGNRLQGADTATTLVYKDGEHVVRDGAFAETHEELGGYYLIDVADLDKAMEYAAMIPIPGNGAVEVRPVWNAG